MHTFMSCRKHVQSFKTFHGKLQEELRPQGTHCKVLWNDGQGKSSVANMKNNICNIAIINTAHL